MTTQYTPELHARLRYLHHNASPTPWTVDKDNEQHYLCPDGYEVINTDAGHIYTIDTQISAEARNALPALLDQIEWLTKELQKAQSEAWKNGYADCLCDIEAVYEIDREAITHKTTDPYQENN